MNKITQLLLCIAVLVSTHAHAKVIEFEEIFTGTIVKTSVIDPDNIDPDIFNDPDLFTRKSALVNGDVTLTLFYPMFDFSPSYYPGAGAFTRTDSAGSFSGNFYIYYLLPDVGGDVGVSSGFFDQDSQSLTLPNTGAYQYSWAHGDVAASITEQGNVSLKINWVIRTPDPLPMPVPEPQTGFMVGCGLLILAMIRFKRKSFF